MSLPLSTFLLAATALSFISFLVLLDSFSLMHHTQCFVLGGCCCCGVLLQLSPPSTWPQSQAAALLLLPLPCASALLPLLRISFWLTLSFERDFHIPSRCIVSQKAFAQNLPSRSTCRIHNLCFLFEQSVRHHVTYNLKVASKPSLVKRLVSVDLVSRPAYGRIENTLYSVESVQIGLLFSGLAASSYLNITFITTLLGTFFQFDDLIEDCFHHLLRLVVAVLAVFSFVSFRVSNLSLFEAVNCFL